MTCSHCIDANNFFDDQAAKKELKEYLKRGTVNPTKKLVDELKKYAIQSLTLLDIGGGIGAIPLELIKVGVVSCTDVDASSAYINTLKSEAKHRGIENNMSFIHGDFVDVKDQIEPHDIVALDKVICCYPSVELLLSSSLQKCKKYYALIYPLDGFLARFAAALASVYFKLRKSNFRPYIHSHKLVNQQIANAGFQLKYTALSFPWKIYIYAKN